MNTAVINVKVKSGIKKKAQRVAEELGISLSGLVNAYLRQLIRTKTVTFSTVKEEPSEYFIEAIKEAEEDVKAGRVVPFKNPKEAVGYLDKMISNEKRPEKN